MGKDGGFLTAKAISKRIKAKGLGRLRWYCQMCEKQCRDENGFKCHTQSASHQRQLALFAENSSSFITRFSNEFRREYLLVLRQRYGTGFVNSNMVYQEHIKDREHVHMNATKWTTLSEFVKELGKQGYCRVEERPDGFWVSYLDRDAAERDKRARDMDRLRMEEEEQKEVELRREMELAADQAKYLPKMNSELLQPKTDSAPVSLEVAGLVPATKKDLNPKATNAFDMLGSSSRDADKSSAPKQEAAKKKRRSRWQDAPKASVLGEIMREEGVKRADAISQPSTELRGVTERPADFSESDGEPWVKEGIIVKVTNDKLAEGAFYGRKGKVTQVIDKFGARVRMNDSDAELELDQDDLETVIPKPGGKVLLLRGRHRGCPAIVKSINVERFSIAVSLEESGEILHDIEYEGASRLG